MEGEVIHQPDPKDAAENKIVAMIGYLGILCLVPLFLKKDSAYAQFHGKQGLVLCLLWVATWALGWLPLFGWGLVVATVILTIVGMQNAAAGKMEELPIIGQYADKIKL